VINPRRRRRRRSLDFTELRESSLIADLVQAHADGDVGAPDAVALALAPTLSHWSIAEGPCLVGIDGTGKIISLDVWCLARDCTWAVTSEGAIRLSEQSRIPLSREEH
jgi:hypothetical protein